MARIAGIDLPRNKRIEIALTYIYGIGRSTSQKILAQAGIDANTRSDNLTESEVAKIRENIDKSVKVEGDLRRDISMNIKASHGSWLLSWPSSQERSSGPWQRTKTNARTRKGPARTVAGKKK